MRLSSVVAWIAGWIRLRSNHAQAMQLASTTESNLRNDLRAKSTTVDHLQRDNEYLRERVNTLEQEVNMLTGKIDVQTSQLEELAAWEAKLLARHEAEAAIEARRKVSAMETITPQEPDLL